MKRILIRTLIASSGLLALLAVTLWFAGDTLIRHGINVVGPQLLGVELHIEKLQFKPLRGRIRIQEFRMGNPTGYSTNALCQVEAITVQLAPASLLSRSIRIHAIEIQHPVIQYEWQGRHSNVGALLETLESKDTEDDTTKTRQIHIEVLRISKPHIKLYAQGITRAPLNLYPGEIVLRNLGGPDQSTAHIVARILQAVATTSLNAAASAGVMLDDGVRYTAGLITRTGDKAASAVAQGSRNIGRAIGNAFRSLRRKPTNSTNENATTNTILLDENETTEIPSR